MADLELKILHIEGRAAPPSIILLLVAVQIGATYYCEHASLNLTARPGIGVSTSRPRHIPRHA